MDLTNFPSDKLRELWYQLPSDFQRSILAIMLQGMPFAELAKLLNIGCFGGITDREVFEQISKRTNSNNVQKENLGKFLTSKIFSELENTHDRQSIFIESGSTLAFLSGYLACKLEKLAEKKYPEILTNNCFTLTAFPLGKVCLTGGRLFPDYFGFFGFISGRRPARQSEEEKQRSFSNDEQAADRQEFDRLKKTLERVDQIYMTASDFGLLMGPLVGNRANAIFKYCLLNLHEGRMIRICLPYSNLHLESSYVFDEKIKRNCYSVFNIGSEDHKHNLAFTPQILGDFKFLSDRIYVDSVLGSADVDDQPRSAPAELGLTTDKEGIFVKGGNIINKGLSRWIGLIERCNPGRIEIIVGFGHVDQVNSASIDENEMRKLAWQQREKLEQGIDEANKVFKEIGLSRFYSMKAFAGTDDPFATKIVIE